MHIWWMFRNYMKNHWIVILFKINTVLILPIIDLIGSQEYFIVLSNPPCIYDWKQVYDSLYFILFSLE